MSVSPYLGNVCHLLETLNLSNTYGSHHFHAQCCPTKPCAPAASSLLAADAIFCSQPHVRHSTADPNSYLRISTKVQDASVQVHANVNRCKTTRWYPDVMIVCSTRSWFCILMQFATGRPIPRLFGTRVLTPADVALVDINSGPEAMFQYLLGNSRRSILIPRLFAYRQCSIIP